MSDETPGRKESWTSLRTDYPTIPSDEFLAFVKKVDLRELDDEGIEILRLLLSEADERAKRAEEERRAVIETRLQMITASMVHGELSISVPDWLDLQHVQAYIVYGLIMPSSSRTYAGSRNINPRTIRDFVERKLGLLFDPDKYQQAEDWLIQQGVVDTTRGYALNLKENESGVSPEGRAIIIEAKRLMCRYRPTRQE